MFDWDDGNVDHIRDHRIEPDEVEEVLLDPDALGVGTYNAGGERRQGALGSTESGRILVVVFTERHGWPRVVTARDATETEKRPPPAREVSMPEANQRVETFETVRQLVDIPDFQSEDEEHAFWSTHQLGEELLNATQPLARDLLPPPRERTRNVAVRFDETTLQRVRALATRRHLGYQTLIKQFVAERLDEEEKRDGIVK